MRFKSEINSEMVYLILEGISQFSLLTQNKATLDKEQMKRLNKIQYEEDRWTKGDFMVKVDTFIIEDKSVNLDKIQT